MQDTCCFACACCAHALQHFGPGAKADWSAPWQDNFYTLTVYEKGAEVVRLYHTLLGVEGFRRAHNDMTVAMPMCCMPCLSQAHLPQAALPVAFPREARLGLQAVVRGAWLLWLSLGRTGLERCCRSMHGAAGDGRWASQTPCDRPAGRAWTCTSSATTARRSRAMTSARPWPTPTAATSRRSRPGAPTSLHDRRCQ